MKSIHSASQATAFIESLILAEPRPYGHHGLDGIRRLLAAIDQPHCGLTIAQIAGSKGKGSTALLLEALLRQAGASAGTFTSPHLNRWNERFRIDGVVVEDALLVTAIERLRPHVQRLRHSSGGSLPSFFELLTATALLLFRQAGVDWTILETGLGGRLDATTAVQPTVTCITGIELEHVDKLGGTVAAIAAEKAGIIKPTVPIIAGPMPEPAMQVVAARAQALGSQLQQPGPDYRLAIDRVDASGTQSTLTFGGSTIRLDLPLLGGHMAHNAALAVLCARSLLGLDEQAALQRLVDGAFRQISLPARCEIVQREPWIVIDAAHTPRSAAALQEALALLPVNRRHFVLSFSKSKDVAGFCRPLLQAGDRITLTCAEPSRSLSVACAASALREQLAGVAFTQCADPVEAAERARQGLNPGELLCITGSVYMAGVGRAVSGVSGAAGTLAKAPFACHTRQHRGNG